MCCCVCRQQGLNLGSGQPMLPASVLPLKTLMNLTTSVDSLAFNPDTQVRSPGSLCPAAHHGANQSTMQNPSKLLGGIQIKEQTPVCTVF